PAETGAADRSGADPATAADRERTLATPKTRGVAKELEVDIDTVPAVEEREGEAFVTEEAVREYAEAQRAAQAADVSAEAEVSTGTGAATGPPEEREERVPYKGVRRTIGERMEESKYTAPHVSHHDTVEVAQLVETRATLKERAEERGVQLTYMPFVMKAVVAALKEFPFLNSSLDEDAEEIVKKHYYNIGVAVATDAGLMVPVVDDVDRKGLLELAAEVNDLATQARERTIDLEDLRGSTFSITNFGAIGGEYATPIINYPEVGILGLGAIEERPVVEDGEVVARPTLPLSLSIDHRVVDGAIAADFTNTVMEYLKNPTLLLLE
ncbi:MAG: dihydrolipoamide acetyltransferase family protein, partial [Halodesulfurarchaeum sp.]